MKSFDWFTRRLPTPLSCNVGDVQRRLLLRRPFFERFGRVVFAAVFLLVSAFGEQVRSQDEDISSRFHAVIVGATNCPRIGESVRADIRNIEYFLRFGIPAHRRGRFVVLEAGNANRQAVLTAIQRLSVRSEDIFFFYYAGHGSTGVLAGHFLSFDNRGGLRARLNRSEILNAMRAKNPRLTVLITDSCGNIIPEPDPEIAPMLEEPPCPTHVNPEILRHLFFRHRGTVNINSAERGKLAFCRPYPPGGLFTDALCRQWTRGLDEMSHDQRITWEVLVSRVTPNVNASFEAAKAFDRTNLWMHNQRNHNPWVWDVGEHNGIRSLDDFFFGITVKPHPDIPGLEVRQVYEGSPAAWYGFRPGFVLQFLGKHAYDNGSYREPVRLERLHEPRDLHEQLTQEWEPSYWRFQVLDRQRQTRNIDLPLATPEQRQREAFKE